MTTNCEFSEYVIEKMWEIGTTNGFDHHNTISLIAQNMLKKLSHFLIGRTLFSLLIAGIIFFLGVTVRWKHENKQIYKLVKRRKKPYIIISWHEHIIGMTWNLPRPITTLNSPHSDGKLLGTAIKLVGLNVVWGSSNKQALSGFRELAKELKKGHSVGITPDGPRGPARTLAMGPIALAHQTGIEIIPVVFAADRQWLLNSWDKTRIPKPFSSSLVLWGEPIRLPILKRKKNEILDKKRQISREIFESWRLQIENELNTLTEKCDALIAKSENIKKKKNKRS